MKLLKIAIVLAGAAAVITPSIAQDQSSVDLLTGVWQFLPPEGVAADEPHLTGQIVFTDTGTMSVQAMDPDATLVTEYMVNGYEAFYGTFEAKGTFVVTVEAALARDLIGQSLERAFVVDEDRLTLTPSNPEETWSVTYERL